MRSLIAALNVSSDTVHGCCCLRHTHFEFFALSNSLVSAYPRCEYHVICDNYGTHKHQSFRAQLAAQPLFHFHVTPTSASRLNLDAW